MKQFHVISHTHWDREWYQPFEVFRHRLVDLIDHLLEIYREYPEYVFELDAQTVCLEDYLEVRPYRRAELERYIRSGNLKVGPWYVQNDFFLTGGEESAGGNRVGGGVRSVRPVRLYARPVRIDRTIAAGFPRLRHRQLRIRARLPAGGGSAAQ